VNPKALRTGPSFESVLRSRKMCRDFLAEPIEAEVLTPVLHAAFRAPAAGNTSALELLVLTEAQVQQYWNLTLPDSARSEFAWPGLLNAPALVIPTVRSTAYLERYSAADKKSSRLGSDEQAWAVPYWYIDGGAAVMALLLAAEAAGLGALFFGQFEHEPALAQAFGLPESCRALGTLALGWPAANGRAPSSSARAARPEPESLIHHQRW